MADSRVVLDTDFISGITSYKAGDAADLFRRTFQDLGKLPVVTPYVAQYELEYDAVAQVLIKSGDIVVIPYNDFFPDEGTKHEQYKRNFYDIHNMIREIHYSQKQDNIPELRPDEDLTLRHSKMSFGEIHSILMAVELGIPLFYSNDSDPKNVARRFPKGKLTVKNAEEIAEELKGHSVAITGDERRYIGHYYSRKKRD